MPSSLLSLMLLAGLMLPMPQFGNGPARAQLVIHERLIIRIPRMQSPPPPPDDAPPPPVRWVEHHGPRCIASRDLMAARVNQPQSIDLLVERLGNVRARFDDDCPALGFYDGFYVTHTDDGMICAGRDVIRSRSGDQCRITAFHRLKPHRR